MIHCCIEQGQTGGIHHILCIVQQHHAALLALADLIFLEREIEPVEAIRLGRRPGRIVNDQPHPGVPCSRIEDSTNCRRIVAIAADVDRPVFLRPDLEGVGNRWPDNRRFLPSGNQNRRSAL